MHSLAVRLVPDESGHQAPQTDESDHERQERLRELSPHTSPLLLVFPFRGPPLSVSLPLFLLVLLLPCATRACFIYPVPLPMFSYFQTRFALPRSTSQAHTPAQWRRLIFFLMPVCCFTHSSLPPPSLTLFLSHLPLWFKSLPDKLSTRNSVISLCLVLFLFRQTGRDKFEPLCALLLLLFPLVTLWWQSAEMKPIERSSTSLLNSRHFCFARPFLYVVAHLFCHLLTRWKSAISSQLQLCFSPILSGFCVYFPLPLPTLAKPLSPLH